MVGVSILALAIIIYFAIFYVKTLTVEYYPKTTSEMIILALDIIFWPITDGLRLLHWAFSKLLER